MSDECAKNGLITHTGLRCSAAATPFEVAPLVGLLDDGAIGGAGAGAGAGAGTDAGADSGAGAGADAGASAGAGAGSGSGAGSGGAEASTTESVRMSQSPFTKESNRIRDTVLVKNACY